MLAVKIDSTFGGETETVWETYKISQNSNNNNAWNLDWSTSSTTSGVAKLETALNQDINDSGGIDGAAVRIAVSSDATSTSGGAPTAYYLSKDTEGVLWISKGSENEETEKYEIGERSN